VGVGVREERRGREKSGKKGRENNNMKDGAWKGRQMEGCKRAR